MQAVARTIAFLMLVVICAGCQSLTLIEDHGGSRIETSVHPRAMSGEAFDIASNHPDGSCIRITFNRFLNLLFAYRRYHVYAEKPCRETQGLWKDDVGSGLALLVRSRRRGHFAGAYSLEEFGGRLANELRGVPGLLDLATARPDAPLELEVHALEGKESSLGWSWSITLATKWTLRSRCDRVLWEETVEGSHSASTGEAFSGVKREKLANEGAFEELARSGIGLVSAELERRPPTDCPQS